MTQTEKKKTPAPKWKKGDTIQRAGMVFAKLTGDVSYSGTLHTEQWLAPAVYHDGSSGQFASSSSDKKINPKEVFVVMESLKIGEAVPKSIEDYAAEFAERFEVEKFEDFEYCSFGICEAALADLLGEDSIILNDDHRIRKTSEEASIICIADLFA